MMTLKQIEWNRKNNESRDGVVRRSDPANDPQMLKCIALEQAEELRELYAAYTELLSVVASDRDALTWIQKRIGTLEQFEIGRVTEHLNPPNGTD